MLKAFVDDSGSGGDSTWVVLAGYTGTAAEWAAFSAEWQDVLDRDPPIRYFKSAEAERLHGEFRGFSKAQKDARLDEFIAVIQRRARQAIECRMRQSYYNEIIKARILRIWDDPYYFLLTGMLLAGSKLEKYAEDGDLIEFIF